MFGGYFDEEWEEPTRELFDQMQRGQWQFFTSAITVAELAHAPVRVRDVLSTTFKPESIVDPTAEMEQLASLYLAQSVVSRTYSDDARHVAVCSVLRFDYLVSWNFRHLVNVEREKRFNAVNLLHGYHSVRIVSPLELIYAVRKDI